MPDSDDVAPVEPPTIESAPPRSSALARDVVPAAQIGGQSAFGGNDWWNANNYHNLPEGGFARDIECDAGTVDELAVVATSIRGHKHTLDGKPNEDAFALRVATDADGARHLVIVVCDGLSSAASSAYSARRTSHLVVDLLAAFVRDPKFNLRRINDNLERYLERHVRPLLRDWKPTAWNTPQWGAPETACLETNPQDLNVTITFAIVPTKNGPSGASEAIIGAIGDSPCFVLAKGQWQRLSGRGDAHGAMLSTKTDAFPTSVRPECEQVLLYDGDALCIASDGVGNFLEKDGKNLALGTYLARQWASPIDVVTFVRDAHFDLRSADDDRTVVMCWLSRDTPI
jgi:serine/threonine protein phosphatase PrpC